MTTNEKQKEREEYLFNALRKLNLRDWNHRLTIEEAEALRQEIIRLRKLTEN
jgi:hypothetical protein